MSTDHREWLHTLDHLSEGDDEVARLAREGYEAEALRLPAPHFDVGERQGTTPDGDTWLVVWHIESEKLRVMTQAEFNRYVDEHPGWSPRWNADSQVCWERIDAAPPPAA